MIKTKLSLTFFFEASHFLSNDTQAHPHLWTLTSSFVGKPNQGKLIDMVYVRTQLESLVSLLRHSFLNENKILTKEAQLSPTCETLSLFFMEKINIMVKNDFMLLNPSLQLDSIRVGLCDLEKNELGNVKLYQIPDLGPGFAGLVDLGTS